jgi:hypothetical protein
MNTMYAADRISVWIDDKLSASLDYHVLTPEQRYLGAVSHGVYRS